MWFFSLLSLCLYLYMETLYLGVEISQTFLCNSLLQQSRVTRWMKTFVSLLFPILLKISLAKWSLPTQYR